MNLSRAEENYLKTIYHLEQVSKEGVSTNAIAEKLESKPSSVTDMVQKLADKGLLTYVKYKGTTLSLDGKRIAVGIVRKHRLWEVFLVEKLHFNWDEVHVIAEQLEHIQSEKLTNQLDAFLGFPKVDPHGDPIPDAQGNYSKTKKQLLSNVPLSSQGICVGVKNSESEFLRYLDKKNISIGSKIEVLNREEFDQSLYIKVDETEFYISKAVSENIYIKIS